MKRKFLLITANVGSLFEKSCRIHNGWLTTLIQEIERVKADFVAIHMQEVGGKHYEECSSQVPPLVDKIADQMNQLGYSIGRAYLDLEYYIPDEYNALGSLFFVHDSISPLVEQYDFREKKFERMKNGFEMVQKDLALCTRLRKAKFPKHFWPAIKWGRKGFIHCRFRHNKTPIDFLNVHLFHDESNIALIHENPSLYSDNRKRALNYVLDEAARISDNSVAKPNPLFVFGDLNFRLHSPSFLNRITVEADQRHDSLESHSNFGNSGNSLLTVEAAAKQLGNKLATTRDGEQLRRTVSAIEFRRSPNGSRTDLPSSCVLRIERNRFDYFNHKKLLHEWRGYLEDDQEAKSFPSLHELNIQFPPTYPWSEDPDESEALMKTRAPAWCDRVLMNEAAFEIVERDQKKLYDSIGKEICMGDHKPVILTFTADV